MLIHDLLTGKLVRAVIEPMKRREFRGIDRRRFDKFNWGKHKTQEVYKLRLESDEVILGLMCIEGRPEMDAVEIVLLEVGKENLGATKRLDHIVGCLISFACLESFIRGYEGFTFLMPKTVLITHYRNKYGFEHIPIRTPDWPNGIMILNKKTAVTIISRYTDQDISSLP